MMNGGAAEQGSAAMAEKTVLVVEDNDLNMKLFHDLLEAHGYHILQTKDGMEALKLAREHHPDLILMDIQLPEISGLEVTKWLKEDDDLKTIPVVVLTTSEADEDILKSYQLHANCYVTKPVDLDKFLTLVKRLEHFWLSIVKLPSRHAV